MALETRGNKNTRATGKAAGAQGAQQQGDFEKAKGFLNLSITTKNGDAIRLFSAPMRESNEIEKQIVEFLADPETREERVKQLLGRLVLQYNPTRSTEEMQLGLGE